LEPEDVAGGEFEDFYFRVSVLERSRLK
jgi:hypothetical protein